MSMLCTLNFSQVIVFVIQNSLVLWYHPLTLQRYFYKQVYDDASIGATGIPIISSVSRNISLWTRANTPGAFISQDVQGPQ